MPLALCPITQKEAFAFVELHHRHHEQPRGFKFAIAAQLDGAIVGVVIVGRPNARMSQEGDPYLAEVTRNCVIEGVKNGCSFLYAAAWRCARAMGYLRLVTYTLPEEGGVSLVASGWRLVGAAGGGLLGSQGPAPGRHPPDARETPVGNGRAGAGQGQGGAPGRGPDRHAHRRLLHARGGTLRIVQSDDGHRRGLRRPAAATCGGVMDWIVFGGALVVVGIPWLAFRLSERRWRRYHQDALARHDELGRQALEAARQDARRH